MNIILSVNSLNTGGAEKQAYLIKEYLSRDFNIFLLVLHTKKIEKNFLYKFLNYSKYLYKIIRLRIKLNNVSHVLSIMPQSHYASIILKILFKARLHISIRNDLRYYKANLEDINSYKFKILTFFVDSFIVQSNNSARLLKWKNVQKEIHVINNLLEVPKANNNFLNFNDRSGIVFVQRLDWQKDPIHMLEIIKRLDRRIKISIYGKGEYLKLFKEYLIGFKNVKIYGKVQSEIIKQAIENNLLGILTSFFEGMPNIIAEYILNGCIPVSTANVYTDNLNLYKEKNLVLKGINASIDAEKINQYYFELYSDKNKQSKIAKHNYYALLDFHNDKSNYSDWNDVFDNK